MMGRARRKRRHSREFLSLWVSQVVSLLGSQVGGIALTVVAVNAAHAGAVEVGVLTAARYVPFALFAVPIGVLVDRFPQHLLMVTSDVVRLAVVTAVIFAAATTGIGLSAMYAAALLTGTFHVLFDTACQAAVPPMVQRDSLARANRWMQSSQSSAELGGPALAGVLIGLIGATAALAVDAASFLMSAAFVTLSGVQARVLFAHTLTASAPARPSLSYMRVAASEAMEGARYILRRRELRALTGEAACFNLLDQALLPLFLLYALSETQLGVTGYGVVLTAGGVGTLVGALGSDLAIGRWGFGSLLIGTGFAGCASYLLIPLAPHRPQVAAPVLAACMFLSGVATGVANVQGVTLRQLITPEQLLGRVTAAFRAVAFGVIPIGAIGGGLLGEWLGLRAALAVLAILLLLTPLWLVCSPIRSIRSLPQGVR
jgi:MFS family permease